MTYKIMVYGYQAGQDTCHTIDAETPEIAVRQAVLSNDSGKLVNLLTAFTRREIGDPVYSSSILGGKGGYAVPYRAWSAARPEPYESTVWASIRDLERP